MFIFKLAAAAAIAWTVCDIFGRYAYDLSYVLASY